MSKTSINRRVKTQSPPFAALLLMLLTLLTLFAPASTATAARAAAPPAPSQYTTLDAPGTIDHMVACRVEAERAEVAILAAAAHYADLHGVLPATDAG